MCTDICLGNITRLPYMWGHDALARFWSIRKKARLKMNGQVGRRLHQALKTRNTRGGTE